MAIEVGPLLKQARENADIQQKDLAAAAQMQPSRLSRIESGQAEPDRREIMALIEAIDTAESHALAEDLRHDFKHIVTPNWADLAPQERETLREADIALDRLLQHKADSDFPPTLIHYANDLEEKLRLGIRYLILVDHQIVFIGPLGVGKSTVINTIFGLMLPPKKGVRKLAAGLLPVGSGRVTAFEYRIAWGPKTLILIEPEAEAIIRNDVRGLCEYWFAEAKGTEKPLRPLPEELERVYRSMAGLSETSEDDPVKGLITPEITEPNDLFSIVLRKMNLPGRRRTELSYDADLERNPGEDEIEWIRRRLRQINLGKLSDFSLPRGVTLVMKNPRLRIRGYNLTVVDTRGLDENVSREDLAVAETNPYALCVLCSGFRDAPTRSILSELERAKNRRFETIEKKRFIVLVLPQRDEATQLPSGDSDEPIEEQEGYRLRRRQVEKALGPYAEDTKVLLFNAGGADRADDMLDAFGARIREMRELVREELEEACISVDLLIAQQAEAQFEECQRQVRAKFEFFLKEYGTLEDTMTPIHLRTVDEIMRCHASSIYSATRYAGQGRTISFYHIFNMQVREVADEMATPAVNGLKTLLKELAENWGANRPDTLQARTYIMDLIGTIDRKQREFVEAAEADGDSTFRPVFEADLELWHDCLSQRGLGSGYRDRVGAVIRGWFHGHREIPKKVDSEIHKAWGSTFLAWAREIVGD
jgi:transcriptional regulator with XRE-family HTH domain